ncbi:MAG: efflux transporter outer membrane subunit [Thermoguttaceae bacterium]|nr:efflux transporter outer membrane subunit [Thermoguttaceae bacterium]
MKTNVKQGIALCALMALTTAGGCKVGSEYVAPQTAINASSAYKINQSKNVVDDKYLVRQQVGADVASWWSLANDEALTELTREAVSSNLSLREALFRIQSARAMVGSTRANLMPAVMESGGYTFGRSATTKSSYNMYDLATGMSWEIDFFGRIARQIEAANADVELQRELYRNAYVILTADVAQTYIDARSYQEQIKIAKANIRLQEESYDIAKAKSEIGSTSRLDEQQALGVCNTTRSTVLSLESMYQQAVNRMNVLCGKEPGTNYADNILNAGSEENWFVPAAPPEILVGIPADLLRRRPDIRAIEQQIIAQNARVGVAIADLYPYFTLNGSFGLSGNSVTSMFDGDAISASVGPAFHWNVLNFGRYRFNIEAQRFTQEALVATYQDAVITAAQEVDDALETYVNEHNRAETLGAASAAYLEAYNISRLRYDSGEIDFQRVLDSQAGLLASQLQSVQSRASEIGAIVKLYRALGGDWVANGSDSNVAPQTAQSGAQYQRSAAAQRVAEQRTVQNRAQSNALADVERQPGDTFEADSVEDEFFTDSPAIDVPEDSEVAFGAAGGTGSFYLDEE